MRTTWLDTASITRAGTPAIGFGPGDIAAETAKWAKVVKAAGAKVD